MGRRSHLDASRLDGLDRQKGGQILQAGDSIMRHLPCASRCLCNTPAGCPRGCAVSHVRYEAGCTHTQDHVDWGDKEHDPKYHSENAIMIGIP